MLVQLSIRDIVLIERLDINFEAGLSVLTGETGAGKSILLDCLALALGSRGDASLVRHGADQGRVTAVFDLPADHPARLVLRGNGFDDDGDIILKRIQSKDGRSRVFINDQAASVALMREVGKKLVEIHGQHDDRALIDTDTHRNLLDSFGGLLDDKERVNAYYHQWCDVEKQLQALKKQVEETEREADFLTASLEELDGLSPQPGEEEDLAARRAHMIKFEKIAADISEANETLAGNGSPVVVLANLVRRLERKAVDLPEFIEPVVRSIDEALNALEQAQSGIDDAIRSIDYEPHELETLEERLFALRAAGRKYSVGVEELGVLRDKFAVDLATLTDSQASLADLENQAQSAQMRYDEAALQLSNKRYQVAQELKKAVMAELPALKLERAEFIVEITTESERRGLDGIDRVEYWVRTNPGTRAGPMMKVASGGELSRFLLALKVALTDRGSAPTLVFDEIDTGVGGAVANAIGHRLSRLAQNVQVLSVTHAPQVAARAHQHFLIEKTEVGGNDQVVTRIHAMAHDERVEEISRMLSGREITQEARAAAKRLLERE